MRIPFPGLFFGIFDAIYKSNPWLLKNNLKLAFGRTKLGNAQFKTNDNEIYLENMLVYDIAWPVNPFFSNAIRTVLAKGYDYSKTPAEPIAEFFDPGYITQSLGFTYSYDKYFTTRLGAAIQETFTKKYTRYSDDLGTLDKIEKFKLETGIESVSETSLPFVENMLFTSKLRLFSRFNRIKVWDIRSDNTITAKINKYFNVNLNLLIVYEKDQSPRTQLKEALQLGITYTLF